MNVVVRALLLAVGLAAVGCGGAIGGADAGADSGAPPQVDAGEEQDAGVAPDCGGACADPTPYCHASTETCVECLVSADCPSARPLCSPTNNTCGACLSDTDCGGATPYCALSAEPAKCTGCLTDAHCPAEAPYCDVAAGACVRQGNSCSQPIDVVFDGGSTASFTADTSLGRNTAHAFCGDAQPDGNAELVYRLVLPEAHDVRVQATSAPDAGVDPVLYVRSGACDATQTSGCTDVPGDTEQLDLFAQPAGEYFLFVESWRNPSGPIDVTVSLQPPTQTPANDTCAAPEQIALSGTTQLSAVTVRANDDYQASCNATANSPEVVYAFTLTQPQKLQAVATGSSGVKPVLYLRSACDSSPELSCVAAEAQTATLSAGYVPAGTYYLHVESAGGAGAITVDVTLSTPLAGDTCLGAIPLTVASGGTINFQADTTQALNEYSGTCSYFTDPTRDVELVYKLTLTDAQDITAVAVAPSSSMYPTLYLRAAPCETGTQLRCHDASAQTATVKAINQPPGDYYLFVETYGSAPGVLDVTVSLTAPTLPPANDTCQTAQVLSFPTQSGTVNVQADTTLATNDYVSTCGGSSSSGNKEVVYQVTLTQTRTITVQATRPSGSFTDAVVYVRSTNCASGAELACRDNGTTSETLTLTSQPPGDYFIFVETYGSTSGLVDVAVTLTP